MLKKAFTLLGIMILGASLAGCINPPSVDNNVNQSQATYGYNPQTPATTETNGGLSDYTLENNVNETIENLTPSSNFPQNVSAVVWYGNTLLIGQVKTQELKDKILSDVQQVYGVNKIYNEIVVNPAFDPTFQTTLVDSRITSQIKAKILITKGLSSLNYKIITNHGNVYLLSNGTPANTAIVQQIARETLGVASVNVLFR